MKIPPLHHTVYLLFSFLSDMLMLPVSILPHSREVRLKVYPSRRKSKGDNTSLEERN